MTEPLDPPDPERCQALRVTYNPLIMGGNVWRNERCTEKPHWLIREVQPGKDGRKASMTLCDNCAEKFIKLGVRPPSTYELDWLHRTPC